MSYANSYVKEETLSGVETIEFPWPAREMQLTNDSTAGELQFKLNASEGYRTLKSYETCTIANARIPSVIISGTNIPYRLWALG